MKCRPSDGLVSVLNDSSTLIHRTASHLMDLQPLVNQITLFITGLVIHLQSNV